MGKDDPNKKQLRRRRSRLTEQEKWERLVAALNKGV